MELRDKLADWLWNGKKDYRTGLQLFSQLEVNSDILPFLRTAKPQKIHWSVLLRHMEDYCRIHKIKPAPIRGSSAPAKPPVTIAIKKAVTPEVVSTGIPERKVERPKIDKNPSVRYEDLPVELQVLFDQNGRLSNEMKALHAKLKVIKDDSQDGAQSARADLADGILKRRNKIRENWEAIDSWWHAKDDGQDLIEKAKREVLEKEKRIKANLNYIRRYYGKEKNSEEVALRMKELDKWEISYAKLIE